MVDNPDRIKKRQVLKMDCRRFIWDQSVAMLGENVTTEGAAGLACHIFESYLTAIRIESIEIWQALMPKLKDHLELHIAVCLQLAAKMICRSHETNKLQKYFRRRGKVYSISDINELERDIFKSIGFKLPLRTNVIEASALASAVGLCPGGMQVSELLTQSSELNLPKLMRHVGRTWSTSSDIPSDSLVTPEKKWIGPRELVAGAVWAARQYLPCERRRAATQGALAVVARWAEVEVEYVQCIADCILENLMKWTQRTKLLSQRRRVLLEHILSKRRRLEPIAGSSSSA